MGIPAAAVEQTEHAQSMRCRDGTTVRLSSGVHVQAGDLTALTLSRNGGGVALTAWMRADELRELRDAINRVLP